MSRVLGNVEDPYISQATKDKVKEAAYSMGYKKNVIAKALASGKTNIIEIQIPVYYTEINSTISKKATIYSVFREDIMKEIIWLCQRQKRISMC